MNQTIKVIRPFFSLILLFAPPILALFLLLFFKNQPLLKLSKEFPFLPWQFLLMGFAGTIATIGGVLDWCFHRNPLKMQLSKKERDAEAAALGLGGLPMFFLMSAAMFSDKPSNYLVPILVVLIYTVVMICYDEFVFHIHRCGKTETFYHRMLVFGNAIAWLAWFHFIFCL
jgi:hypothetical protein